MKKVIICGSIRAADEIRSAQDKLEKNGFTVEIPEGVKNIDEWKKAGVEVKEQAERKIRLDLIRGYYETMKDYDIVLVINPEKDGIGGYIGGNTLIEMAFAHVLDKKLYVLFELPDMKYSSEIVAMQPTVLNGDVNALISSES
jgi:hypothetical protein